MKLTLLIVFIYALIVINSLLVKVQAEHYIAPITVATTTPRKAELSPKMPVVQRKDPTPSQAQIILQKSAQYGVDPVVLIDVIRCESGFKETALGDGGYSRGLVQIHSYYHPEITDEMAYDPEFAIDFLAQKISENKGHLWTCYRLLASR